jgi:hypothetical protein
MDENKEVGKSNKVHNGWIQNNWIIQGNIIIKRCVDVGYYTTWIELVVHSSKQMFNLRIR